MKDINQPSPLRLLSVWLLCILGSLSSWYGVIRLGVWIFSEVCMWSFALLGGCIILIAFHENTFLPLGKPVPRKN